MGGKVSSRKMPSIESPIKIIAWSANQVGMTRPTGQRNEEYSTQQDDEKKRNETHAASRHSDVINSFVRPLLVSVHGNTLLVAGNHTELY